MKRSSLIPEFSLLPVWLFAAVLFLGACSGGDGGGGTPDIPSPGSAQSPQQIVAQLVQAGYLKASNTNADDLFGSSVALSNDTFVVGAPHEASNATGMNGNEADNSAHDSGAVYVFTRTAGVWSQQAYLKASNTGSDDNFGYSVALAGDTLVVGAPGEGSNATGVNGNQADNSAQRAGAVYVFTRTGDVWSQQAYLKASNAEAGDEFGIAVALLGDTLAVGAWYEDSIATGVNGNQADNSMSEGGAVYVFTRAAGVWSQEAYLKASGYGGVFGHSLALAGDTLAVGAPFEYGAATGVNGNEADNTAPSAGAVYVFTRAAGVWSQQAYLKASNAGANKVFGGQVALVGDVIAVASRLEDSNGTGINGDQGNSDAPDSGAVYLFTRSGGVWTQKAYLKASNSEAGDMFGKVALSGDSLAVGAFHEDSNATGINGNQADNSAPDSGAVYFFSLGAL